MDPVVRLRSVVCLLGRFPALAGADLDVADGEVVLVSGANGAGKSTLLRLLAGLLPVHRGEARVLGHDLVADRRAHRRAVSLVGHDTACYDDLTTRENLRFAARASGRRAEAADAALEELGLGGQADVTHRRLSAGQRRRLALAVALAREPRLLLLDEPHAGLDGDGRLILDRIVAASPAVGRTVVMASHELELTRPLADREVVVAGGTVRAAATAAPDPARAAPAPALPAERTS